VRVLIVEDDTRLAALLQQGLEEDGMLVDLVRTGEDATAAALTRAYDVISLDVMIPGQDGFAVSSELRRRKVAVPILMLTSRDEVSDRIRGLEAGADDYLTKPFAFEEFVARIRALARRHLMDRSALLVAGPLRVDTSAASASVGAQRLDLTMKEYALLEFLVHNRDRLLDRDQIAEHVWGIDFPESNLVDVYIGRLRRKLAEAGLEDSITTVRHGGYRFQTH
jgi:two-component system OmpR family response regulator